MKYRPRVRSKNHSCSFLRHRARNLKMFSQKSLVRLGSTTPYKGVGGPMIEVNTIDAIENSRSKLKMKSYFSKSDIPQAEWYIFDTSSSDKFIQQGISERIVLSASELLYPIIAKRIYGFKGKGMEKLDSAEELTKFIRERGTNGYYFERFYNYAREYRFHCTQEKVFLKWRKLRKTDAEKRWYFNSDNCVWVGVDNKSFNPPVNIDRIEENCIAAIRSIGLDIGALDVRVQSKGTVNPGFIILEINSAPSLGEQGNIAYAREIEKIIELKINSNG